MVIDVKPATTLAEAADQMEEAMGMCADHYIPVCDVVLSNWSMVCRSVDVDALLELADGLEKDADNIISAARNVRFTGGGPRMGEAKHDAYEWRSIARRIREALEVEHG